MYVKIVGFKCHLDSTYKFDGNSMILLKGESGAGKSTVLQAIYWAMYGNMRGVYNNTGQIKTCSVTLKINHLTIYRQKRPELLKVTISNPVDNNEATYDDIVGQQIIESAFGSKDLWKSCSYISQKERCALLSGSANDRLALLNQLSFDQDNPKDYINTIDQKLKEINTQFINTQAKFTAELDMFTKQIKTRPATTVLSDSEMYQLKTDITNLTSEIDRLYQDVLSHERNIGSYNMVTNQLSQAQNQLNSIGDIVFDINDYNNKTENIKTSIDRLNQQLTLVSHYTNIKSQSDRLVNDISNIKTTIDNIDIQITNLKAQINLSGNNLKEKGYVLLNNITQQTIWQVSQTESQIVQYQNECKKLGCEYDQTSINNLINNYQTQLTDYHNRQKHLNIYNQLQTIRSQLLSYDDISTDKIKELEQGNNKTMMEISELKKGLELLQCPQCSASLRYVNSKLITGEGNPVRPEQIQEKESEYNNRLKQINNIRTGLSLKDQEKSLEKQLEGVDLNDLQINQTVPDPNLITRLSRIQILQPPQCSSEHLKAVYNHNQLLLGLAPLETQKSQLELSLSQLTNQLNSIEIPNTPSHDQAFLSSEISKNKNELIRLNNEYNTYIQTKNTRDNLINTINQLKTQQQQIKLNPNSKTIYESTKQLLETTKTKLSDAEYTKSIVTQQKQLETKREEVLKLNDDFATLQRLKQNAINIECKQLQDTVDTINQTLGDILPLFFNEPIEMSLLLYKTLKTKKETKPGLNIVIKHKGTEYDNINQLSGGEGDRISLALVLALNQVSSSPVIMLDECISSLDGSLKESCIETMKNLSGKTIICVDHEGVEGYYDKTIPVSH